MKKAFIVKVSDHSKVIGICTSRKKVVEMITKYFKHYMWSYSFKKKSLYNKICRDLRRELISFIKIEFGDHYDYLDRKTKIEVEEFYTNHLYCFECIPKKNDLSEVESHGMAHEIEFIDEKNN